MKSTDEMSAVGSTLFIIYYMSHYGVNQYGGW